MCPFPIYPLYTRTVILSLDKPIADCFLFRPRKSREKCRKRSHTNVSNASVTRASRVSQTLLHPPSPLPSMGITHQKGLGTIVYKTAHVCFRGRKWVHTRLSEKDRTQGLTRQNTGRFGWGRYYYPRSVPHVSETLRGRSLKRQTLPLLGLGQGCSQRTQRAFGTAMRLCASLFRGVAAPLGCVICLQLGDVAVFLLCAQYFLIVRGGGGITTLGALCVLLKRWTAACQKGSFAAF